MQRLPVYDHCVAGCPYSVSWNANDTLDKVFARIERIMKDDHIAALRRMEEIGYLIYQHIFIRLQARLHTRTIHSETLRGKANDQKDQQRKGDGLDQFPDETSSFL